MTQQQMTDEGKTTNDQPQAPQPEGEGSSPRRTTMHVGLNVRGAIQWRDKELRNLVSDENGDRLSPREARDWLMDQLAQGIEMLPIGDACDNWDAKTGCGGHAAETP